MYGHSTHNTDARSLTNSDLLLRIQTLVREERRLTVEVLRHLREIERRQLFAEIGYPSLFAYCTKVLKYSESAACRRIEAMRAMRETKELETKIETGELSLATICQARTAMRQHEKKSKMQLSIDQKKHVMLSLSGQSKRTAEKNLAAEFPLSAAATLRVPVMRKTTALGSTRVTIEFSEDEMKVFNEINRLTGRPLNLKDTVLRMAAKELNSLRKARGELKAEVPPVVAAADAPPPAAVKKQAGPRSRVIPVEHKRSVWRQAEGRCEYVSDGAIDGSNGRRCTSTHALEYDHRVPLSLGGTSTQENLRLYCQQHNALAATHILGRTKMAKHYRSLR